MLYSVPVDSCPVAHGDYPLRLRKVRDVYGYKIERTLGGACEPPSSLVCRTREVIFKGDAREPLK
jgi:hypothetical protein